MELNELSKNVYKHFIRSAVLDVTEDEVTEILVLYPNSNPLEHNNFIENVIHSGDIPKEGPIDFFTNVVKMVMLSVNPIKRAFGLANEYISNDEDDIAEGESIEERANACESLYKMIVQFLRGDQMSQESDDNDGTKRSKMRNDRDNPQSHQNLSL